jgi:1,2-phenylacetyl-CoA epoxidase PaaB subunit
VVAGADDVRPPRQRIEQHAAARPLGHQDQDQRPVAAGVHRRSLEHALHDAIESADFDAASVWVWWVVPDDEIIRSDADDIDTLFAPALDKTYRQQTHYGFVSPRRQQRGRQKWDADERR